MQVQLDFTNPKSTGLVANPLKQQEFLKKAAIPNFSNGLVTMVQVLIDS